MKYLRIISRILIGVMFIFSGLTKAIDPIGSGFIIAEYLNALGLNFLIPFSVIGGIAQSMVEFLLGVALIVGLRMRLSTLFSMLIMVFFTFFTLWVALYNPVSHCGCFGDVLLLSNWETFYKNLIFTPFTIFLFLQRKHFVPTTRKIGEWIALSVTCLASVLLSLYCFRYLPLIDFTGFKPGTHIPEAMTVPEGEAPQFETTFVYEKDSKTQIFTINNLPDSTWKYVSHNTKIVKEGATPLISRFEIGDYKENRYVTDSILSLKGHLLVLTIPYAEKVKFDALERVAALSIEVPMILLSGSVEDETISLLGRYGIDVPYFYTDIKTLFTMVRANPGLMLLHDATVVAKWSMYNTPSVPHIKSIMGSDSEIVSAKSKMEEHLVMGFFILFFSLLLFVLNRFFRHVARKS
ncbi:MAG: DoxX family protein [Prevotellaceae bacterium]|jgi:uncharacterized membrane protein YphA (DoxX/SURF4 family)|nr:DoxX family protein [Prevotellaceae bacterium]